MKEKEIELQPFEEAANFNESDSEDSLTDHGNIILNIRFFYTIFLMIFYTLIFNLYSREI